MSLTNENGGSDIVMPVSPMGYNNGGFGGFGGDGWWVILFLFALMGGGFGGFGFGGNEMTLPYLWNTQTQNDVNRGFDNAGVSSQLSGIQTSLSNGFASAEVADCNRAMNSMQTAYTNQIADLERSYAAQTANTQNFTNLSSQLAQCCCDNRLATANLNSTILAENCADRAALSDGVRDIITNQTANTQRILDQMCNDKIDAKNEKIADLERQLTMASLSASQGAQTAALLADNSRQTAVLEDYLNPVARPAYIVQNPNCCAQNTCGCGSF